VTARASDHPNGGVRTQPSFLEPIVAQKRVIVCCGAGGVGKTTTSAALGLAGALVGRRVLVLTIDPARRLAEAMGLPETSRAPARIDPALLAAAGAYECGELSAWMLNPQVVFEGMVRRLTTDEGRVKQILENRLYKHISGMVAGMQEYTAAEALYTLYESGDYDLIVLDTPPSRNALEFLEAPRKLSAFLDERILSVFLPKKGGILKAASGLIENVFTRIFGPGFYGELQTFLDAFSGMFGSMRAHSEAVRKLLTSDEATFVLVTSPEPSALVEANFFQARIESLGVPFAGYVLNRSWAYTRGFASPDALEPPEGSPAPLVSGMFKLKNLAEEERRRAERDRKLLLTLKERTAARHALATPHLGGAIEDLGGLVDLARNLVRAEELPPSSRPPGSVR
jgi:anion-transporting  ArsA/GET3 family ATPase